MSRCLACEDSEGRVLGLMYAVRRAIEILEEGDRVGAQRWLERARDLYLGAIL